MTGPALPRPGRPRRALLWALKVAVSGGILAFLLTRVPISDIVADLARVDGRWLAAGLLAGVPVRLLAAWQQALIAARVEVEIRVREVFAIGLVGLFYNLFLPGMASNVIRWHRLAVAGGRPAETLAAVAFHRVFANTAAVVLALVFWGLAPPRGGTAAGLAALGAALALAVTLQLVLFDRRWTARAAAVIEGSSPRRGRFRPALGRLVRSAGRFGRLPRRLLALLAALHLAKHLVGALGLVAFCRAVGVDLSFAAAVWIRVVILLVGSLPISIAGLGLREASVAATLPLYGIAPATALAVSALLLLRDLIWAALGGVLEAARVLGLPVPGGPRGRRRRGESRSEPLPSRSFEPAPPRIEP